MNDTDSYNDSKKQVEAWRRFLNEGVERALDEKSLARTIGPSLRKAVRGAPKSLAQAPPEEPEKSQGYRGSNIQLFSGDNSVKQALSGAGLNALHIGRILAALQKDFEEAGFEIMEKRSRKIISLNQTLLMLDSMSFDIEQRKKIAGILINLLRLHRVKLDNPSGTDLMRWADVDSTDTALGPDELPPEAPDSDDGPSRHDDFDPELDEIKLTRKK